MVNSRVVINRTSNYEHNNQSILLPHPTEHIIAAWVIKSCSVCTYYVFTTSHIRTSVGIIEG